MLDQTKSDFQNLIYLDADLPPYKVLKRLKKSYKKSEEGHRESQYRFIHRATLTFKRLEGAKTEVKTFFQDSFWANRSYKPNPEKLLLHCMQYIVNAPSCKGKKYTTASEYAKAVTLILDEGFNADDIFDQLKAQNGPYAVIKKQRRDEEEEESRQENVDNDQEDDEEVVETPRLPAATRAHAKLSQQASSSSKNLTNKKAKSIFRKDKDIAVTGEKYQGKILVMKKGEQRWMLVERVENEGDVLRFVVVKMKMHTK